MLWVNFQCSNSVNLPENNFGNLILKYREQLLLATLLTLLILKKETFFTAVYIYGDFKDLPLKFEIKFCFARTIFNLLPKKVFFLDISP